MSGSSEAPGTAKENLAYEQRPFVMRMAFFYVGVKNVGAPTIKVIL
jgi:hypothetical protein